MSDKEIEKAAFSLANEIRDRYALEIGVVPDIEKMIMDEFRSFRIPKEIIWPEELTEEELKREILRNGLFHGKDFAYTIDPKHAKKISRAIHAAQERKEQEPILEYERLENGKPCKHPGCLSHVSHPCEGCGRIAGRNLDEECYDNDYRKIEHKPEIQNDDYGL